MPDPINYADILSRGFTEEVVILNREFQVAGANAIFCQTHGVEEARIIGLPCHTVLHSCRISCQESISDCPLREALVTGEKASATIRNVPAGWGNGNRHFQIEVYPVPADRMEVVSRAPGKARERPPADGTEGLFFLHITREITESVENELIKEKMWMEILGRLEKLYGTMIEKSDVRMVSQSRLFERRQDIGWHLHRSGHHRARRHPQGTQDNAGPGHGHPERGR